MYQKTFGGRAPSGPAVELIALPTDPLAAKKGPLRGRGGGGWGKEGGGERAGGTGTQDPPVS